MQMQFNLVNCHHTGMESTVRHGNILIPTSRLLMKRNMLLINQKLMLIMLNHLLKRNLKLKLMLNLRLKLNLNLLLRLNQPPPETKKPPSLEPNQRLPVKKKKKKKSRDWMTKHGKQKTSTITTSKNTERIPLRHTNTLLST